jgi:hypothetical protein
MRGFLSSSITTNQLLCHEDTSLPMQHLFSARFSIVDNGHVWMLIRGHINRLYCETPTDLRMGVPGFRPPQPTLLALPQLLLR